MNRSTSIVICTKDRPQLLLESIDSVLKQTLIDWELIIVDDGSYPPVSDFITHYLDEKDYFYKIVRNSSSQGIAVARNMGVENSSGKFIYFLDDDDLLVNDALEKLVNFLCNYDLDCLFHMVKPFGLEEKIKKDELHKATTKVLELNCFTSINSKEIVIFDRKKLFSALLSTVPLSFQRFLCTRDLWHKTGGMRQSSMIPEPEWAVKSALLGKCGFMSEPIGLWRVDGQNLFSMQKDEYKINQRVIDNMQSLKIYAESQNQFDDDDKMQIKNALANAYFCHAWGLLEQNQRINAFWALVSSAMIAAHFRHVKFLVKLCLPKLKWK